MSALDVALTVIPCAILAAWAVGGVLLNLVLNRYWPIEHRRAMPRSKVVVGRLMIGFLSPLVILGMWKIEPTEGGWRMGDGSSDEDWEGEWRW